MMNRILCLFLTLLLLTACSPSRRILRIAQRHDLQYVTTQTVRDTVYRPEIDTEYCVPVMDDVFSVQAEKIDLWGMIEPDTVRIIVHQAGDTIYLEKKVPLTKIVTTTNRSVAWGVTILLGLFLGVFLTYLLEKIK